jgi:hypothetical protein
VFHQLDPAEVARRIVLVDAFVDLRGGNHD